MKISSSHNYKNRTQSFFFWETGKFRSDMTGTSELAMGRMPRNITRLITINHPVRSGQPDFCPGSYCFQIWVLKSSVRGFIFFQNQKILSRGLIFFLNFHTLFAVFYRFQCIWRQKRSKKFRLRRAGSYCFSKFSASGGVLFFSKIHKKNRLPGFYFFWEFSKSPIRGFKEGGF